MIGAFFIPGNEPLETWKNSEGQRTMSNREEVECKQGSYTESNSQDGNIVIANRIYLMTRTLTKLLLRYVYFKFVNISKKPLRDSILNRCPPAELLACGKHLK